MFDGLKKKMAVSVLGGTLRNLASDKDTKSTVTGLIAAAVLAVPGLDLTRLVNGDPSQIAHVAAAVLVFLIGLLATREKADGKTTMLGTVAGAAYACSGSVESVVTGVIIAVLGYLTNKGPETPKGE